MGNQTLATPTTRRHRQRVHIMKFHVRHALCLAFLLTALLTSPARCGHPDRVVDFNAGWRFSLQSEDAYSKTHDDSHWRELTLPHDWSVESPFQENLEGCTGYLPGGIGWYRKHFSKTVSQDELVYLHFDGVYNRAEVWLNGTRLGFHPYGYTPFYFDITSLLNSSGKDNVLAVKVDHSRYADSRWYTGSGIYRDVKMITTNKLHVPVDGTFVTTSITSPNQASGEIQIEIQNKFDTEKQFELTTTISDDLGAVVATETSTCQVAASATQTFHQSFAIQSPRLWSLDIPHLYTATTSVTQNDRVVDRYQTRFGIREIRFDPENGFFLNGKRTAIKGVCLHHDGGLVGAAVPEGVWKRRLAKLKSAGCNAIRTAHNPASKEFLNLCDEMGLLVQEEFYDEWDNPKDKRLNMVEQHDDRITRGHAEFFQEYAKRDLKATMRRDRNHPCIIQWSIGNEIEWTYPRYRQASGYFDADASGNYFWTPPHLIPEEIKERFRETPAGKYVLAETARKLSRWTKEMDTTRPVVSNCILPSVSHVTGYADALDVVGYSYRRVVYDYSRTHFPDTIVMGTENVPQWHEWKAVMQRPFVAGLFLWTGVDYMGESHEDWPRKSVLSGLLDTAGFEKPSFHMMKTLWSDDPHVFLCTQPLADSKYQLDPTSGVLVGKTSGDWERRTWIWHDVNRHWNYQPEEEIVVEVIANSDRVELFLDDRSLGIKSLSDFPDRIFKWLVPFSAGTLEARFVECDVTHSDRLSTAGEPTEIILSSDNDLLRSDGKDVAHIVAQLVDADRNPVRNQELEITFEIEGNVTKLGVDNGSGITVDEYQSDRVPTHQGRCLTIVQSKRTPTQAVIRARAGKLRSKPMTIEVK